ncbi:MAG: TIGR00159 family protein [Anaerolineae bacterium]|nr:TIGR00159 family protein [Anaerolineae bacterium]
MESLEIFIADTRFRLLALDALGWLDLILVTAVLLFLILILLRSRAAFLLRGGLLLILFLLVGTLFLPLPTFDWILRAAFLILLIATPIALQPEIRRWLERTGRATGLSRSLRQTKIETLLPQLLRAVDNLSASHTGALIVLEGDDSLQEIIDTGISVNGRVTAELMQTIFFDKTPLHDGAVIIQGDQVVAASCVLPLTGQKIASKRRLGTRHRASVGLSEICDALIIVVSEETGRISIAHHGHLTQNLDSAALRQRILDFYMGKQNGHQQPSWSERLRLAAAKLPSIKQRPNWRGWFGTIGWLLVAMLMTLALWTFVIEETNPTERPQFSNITLRVEDLAAGMTVMSPLPENIAVTVRTTADVMPTLNTNSFQAYISLAEMESGLHQPTVQIKTGSPNVEVVGIEPPVLDVELAATKTITLPVTVKTKDPNMLSAAYQTVGTPIASPTYVSVTGPEPLVNQVAAVQTTLTLANASATIQEQRPLRAVDETGKEIKGVTLDPDEAQITQIITRKQNAREVGVRATTEGVLPEGYWLSNLRATPNNVTLRGNPEDLAEIGGFLNTLPVDISQAVGNLSVETPLDLPEGITAVDQNGKPVSLVTVIVEIMPRTGDLVVTRPINIINAPADTELTFSQDQLDLLLSGPLPQLREIESDPDLVQLTLDLSTWEQDKQEMTPQVTAPDGVQIQLVPATILVSRAKK